MTDQGKDGAIIPYVSNERDRNVPSPISVTKALEDSGKAFDHTLFRERTRALQPLLMQTGDITFIPLLWGMPYIEEAEIAPNNSISLDFSPPYLSTYPETTLRDPKPSTVNVGPFEFTNYTSEADPMTVGDVEDRVRAVQNFETLRFPHKKNKFNQNGGITVMTDSEGIVRVSLNCPYPLVPSAESPIKYDTSLQTPGALDMKAKLFYAAYLAEMGYDATVIYQAVGRQPRGDSQNQAVYIEDGDAIQIALNEIPSLSGRFDYNPESEKSTWKTTPNDPRSMEQVYRDIISSAKFDVEGNVIFSTKPSLIAAQ